MSAVSEVQGLFDADVIVLTSAIDPAAFAELGPGEAELVARAVDKRKHEFATGRRLVRCALSRLGRPEVEILSGPDRAPIWPVEIRGSISHCNTRAVVALGAGPSSLGIDVENRGELARDLWDMVLLEEERRALEAIPEPSERERRALAVFSAKEAFYKAQYFWSKTFLAFDAVRVDFDGRDAARPEGGFSCTFQLDAEPFTRGTRVRGRYRFDAFPSGEIVTAVRIDPGSAVDRQSA